MLDFFAADGPIARRLEDYEARPSQVRMAERVGDALEKQYHALIEAGTGTGKTLAYLVPAVLLGRRLVVSTGTKALQDQIFYKDIPLVERLLDRPIHAAYLKGRSNYLCLTKLREFQDEGLFTTSETRRLSEIRKWAATTATGDRAEVEGVADDDAVWGRIDARRERCPGSRCPDFEDCFVTRTRREAIEADIVVVNHHLFFADLAIRESEMAQILPDYSAVIFDEAHELEDIATGYFGFHVSNYRLEELLFDAGAWAHAREVSFEDRLAPLRRASDRFFTRLLAIPEGRHRTPGLEGIAELVAALDNVREALDHLRDPGGEAETLARRAGELASELGVFEDPDMENYVSWLDRRGRGVFLESCPVDVAPLLGEALFGRVPTCILTSATLTVGGSTEYVRRRLGLEDVVSETLTTEFDFARQAALYIPRGLPEYRDPDYADQAADEIERILAISRGRAFVLFTSYRQMQILYERLRDRLPFPTLVQDRTSRSRLLAAFREQDGAVLFATAGFWQGIDVPGSRLSAVIIDKLPFQVPSDPLVEARIRRIESQGGHPFSDYQVPAAILRLKQGFGRLIRSRTDRGILAILDSRIRTRGYGRVFLRSLPDYTVVDDPEELRHFVTGEEAAEEAVG